MEHSLIQLDDLPDEIILIILKKLSNCDLLYSLIGVNKRLDRIVNDSTFTRDLTLMTTVNDERLDSLIRDSCFTRNLALIRALNGLSCPFTDKIHDRFCLEILPRINDKIGRLNVEPSSMEQILHATHYPNLITLGLYNVAPESAIELFSNDSYLIVHYQNQISSLSINLRRRVQRRDLFGDKNIFIFGRICIVFKKLQYLNYRSFFDYDQLTFNDTPSINFSSNLLELHVVVITIKDCLFLLDGRFSQLHRLYVRICLRGATAWPIIKSNKKLPNLKCFSLIHEGSGLMLYDEEFVPLLQRMTNLEELSLFFVNGCGIIIDGHNLEKDIINHMTKLDQFTFNIRSTVHLGDHVNLPSNEDIENSFINFKKNRIISCIDYLLNANLFNCHIYSYPYTWTVYDNITNHFPGGLFKDVREISLRDERPFNYAFFRQITESFPNIEKLSLHNLEPQQNDDQQGLIIEYSCLINLHLVRSHETYLEQFLDNNKTCLLNNVYLHVTYDSLRKVTNNFTRAATRINCSKMVGLVLDNKEEVQKIKDYFPRAVIY